MGWWSKIFCGGRTISAGLLKQSRHRQARRRFGLVPHFNSQVARRPTTAPLPEPGFCARPRPAGSAALLVLLWLRMLGPWASLQRRRGHHSKGGEATLSSLGRLLLLNRLRQEVRAPFAPSLKGTQQWDPPASLVIWSLVFDFAVMPH